MRSKEKQRDIKEKERVRRMTGKQVGEEQPSNDFYICIQKIPLDFSNTHKQAYLSLYILKCI